MKKSDEEKTEWVHCNKCNHNTKHAVVAERIQKGSEDVADGDYFVSWQDTYTMFECCGCGSVTLRRRSWFSEWDDVDIEFYPPSIGRPLPRWHDELPSELTSLMKEVYAALQANSKRLALMGARALVDVFMNDKVGDIGGFEQKSAELEKQGLLSKAHRRVLDAALETGHAVIHRGFNPKRETVDQVMDIVENLLHTYVLDEAAEDLKRATPTRKKKPTKQSTRTKK
jgi:hypothetical protein